MLKFVLGLTILFFACSEEIRDPIPAEIFGLTLEKKLVGEQAIEFVNKLHMKTVTAEKNEIGFYGGEKGKAIIYITYYDNKEDAIKNYKKMTERISPANSVFLKGNYRNIAGHEVYTTFGMGQTHYVFVNATDLYWLSAGTMWAEDFLSEYLKYLNES